MKNCDDLKLAYYQMRGVKELDKMLYDLRTEGLLFRDAKDKLLMNSGDISKCLGISESYVNNRIQLLKIDSFLINAVLRKKCSINAALIIKTAKKLVHRKSLLKLFIREKMADDILREVVYKLNRK